MGPLKRDYFGAHTFRVLPGKENAKLKKGEDIRTFRVIANSPICIFTILFRHQLDWSWRERVRQHILCLNMTSMLALYAYRFYVYRDCNRACIRHRLVCYV